jgi:hypothetical protein
MKIFFFFLNIIILSAKVLWRLYDDEDFELMYNETPTNEAKLFLKDSNICKSSQQDCSIMNDEGSYSTGNFINKCCLISTSPEWRKSTNIGCLAVFTGKYFESNLYSLARFTDSIIYYTCHFEKDFIKYDPSTYVPYSTWEIILKEKYDCIYSKTEEECKETSKSFTQKTKCVWFSYKNISPRTQCYGVYDLTDYEFNRLIPYFVLDNMYLENKVLNFSFFGRNNKVIKGAFDLKYNYTMLENFTYDMKMSIEMGSQDAVYSFSKKQTFVGIKDYKFDGYVHRIFLYTTSALEYNNEPFYIIARYKYKKNRNLEENNEEYFENIVKCNPQSILKIGYFKLTLSELEILNTDKIEIKIEKGIDLIGNFEHQKGTIFEGMQFMNLTEEEKIKEQSSIFTVATPITSLQSNYLRGSTTLDRKNVNFFFYYSKDSKVQTIQAKGSFLKENSNVSFEMSPSVNLKEGNTFVPNQLCQAENGEYLYIKNEQGIFYSNFNNDYYYNIPVTPTTTPTNTLTTRPTTNNENYNNSTNNTNNDDDKEATDSSEESGKNETWIRVDKGERLFTRGFSIILISILLWFI